MHTLTYGEIVHQFMLQQRVGDCFEIVLHAKGNASKFD